MSTSSLTLDPAAVGTAPRTPARLTSDAISRLMHAAAAGDQQAWNALVHEFTGLLWTIARAHRLLEADAADVVQATWLRLFEHLGRLHDPGRVAAWLATTARRECLRLLRDGKRATALVADAPECASGEMSPDHVVLERERDRALWRSFARLRTTDQALLRLLVADPRPGYDEIAAALDMRIGSIGPTRQRALKRLRQELDDQGSIALMTA